MNNNCKKEWTRKYINTVFTIKFVNGVWKENMENILFEREKALLPATQGVLETILENEKYQAEIADITRQINQLTLQRTLMANRLTNGMLNVPNRVTNRIFTRPCPDNGCRGFLDSSWNCGLCQKNTCSECHLIKTEGHECNADDVATAKLLKSDTKPCPKCSAGIYKIDGCDQMWCTQCHTAFSWKTGELQTNVHNPHYFEWQRRNGQNVRNPNEILCGREMNHQLANSIRQKLPSSAKESLRKKIDDLIQNTIHINLVDIPNYRVDPVVNNQKLRIGYLRKEIDEDDFKKKVQRCNKMHDKKRETYDILRLFVQTTTDIFYRMNEHLQTHTKSVSLVTDIQKHLDEIEGIRVYTNECLEDISNTYNQKKIMLTTNIKLLKADTYEKCFSVV